MSLTILNVYKISQYVDSTIIVDGSNRSLLQISETFDLFERMSVLEVNEEKTNLPYIVFLANQMPNPNITQKKLKWVNLFFNLFFEAFKEQNSINRWDFELDVYFSRDDWKIFYLIPFNHTKDTKLRWFQYKILNRFLTTNSFMCKIVQRIDNICTFCKKEAETIEHLFVECKEVTSIWSKLQNRIRIKLGIPVVLSKTQIVFGL